MEAITEQNLIKILKEKFPKFIPYWESHINYWGEDDGIVRQASTLTDYVVDVVKSQDDNEIERIFDFIEFLMCHANQSAQEAVATGFLEDLLNRDPHEIQLIKVYQHLGEETLAYCRAWDKFTGVFTKGFHDD